MSPQMRAVGGGLSVVSDKGVGPVVELGPGQPLLQPVSKMSPRIGPCWGLAGAGTAQNPCLGARSPTAAVGWGF